MNISLQPYPKVPPYRFFEPISVKPEDMMTDTEFLLGVLKKLNEVIVATNANSEFIDNYAGKIEEIETEMTDLKQQMIDFKTEINNSITLQFAEIKVELQSMIATALNQANAYTDALGARLEAEIDAVSVGQIQVYDQSTGQLENLQTVIDNLFNMGRSDALTATEYDALDLTATAYDAYDITAYNYDNNGKSLLV